MLQLLIFILSTAGLTFIITRSVAFKGIREAVTRKSVYYKNIKHTCGILNFHNRLKRLKSKFINLRFRILKLIYAFLDGVLNCYACFGFWGGCGVYLLQKYDLELPLYCFIGSIVSLIIIDLIIFIERR